MKAKKFDTKKPPMDLLPSLALEEVAKVFDHGADKYGRHNWTNGFEWSRLIAASMRHLNSFNRGEDADSESKLGHLSHCAATLLMLIEHQKRNLGKDDRCKYDSFNQNNKKKSKR